MEITMSRLPDSKSHHPCKCREDEVCCPLVGHMTKMELIENEIVLHVDTAPRNKIRVYGAFLCPCLEAFVELLGARAFHSALETRELRNCCINGSFETCARYPDRCPRVLYFFDGLDEEFSSET